MKTLFVLAIAALMAALPTLLTSCELTCLSAALPEAARTAPPDHCSGDVRHAGSTSSPSDERHDCGGHAVLSKSAGPPGVLPVPLLAIAGSVPIPSQCSVDHAARVPDQTTSPPPARSSPILRL